MAKIDIITLDEDFDNILSQPTRELLPEDVRSYEIQTLIRHMIDTCDAKDGLGLAANQIGFNLNACIYKVPGESKYSFIANPKIIARSGKFNSYGEGCLSLPGRRFDVKPAKSITVEGLDKDGNFIKFKTKSKSLARILQHEIDHLNGITLNMRGKEI